VLALSAALFAVGTAALAVDHVARWATAPGGGASMIIYLGEGVEEERARTLVGELATLSGVEHAELIAPAESLERLHHALGADRELLEGVEVASMPASVEVTLAPGVRDVIAMSPTVRALRGAPGVNHVTIEDAGSERTVATLRVVRLVAWAGAALLAGLAIVIVVAAIRIRLDRAERELAVAHLLGAGPAYFVIPTALAGALQAALAAVLAAALVLAGLAVYGADIAGALEPALGPVTIAAPGLDLIALFLAGGAMLGLVGGGLAGASRAVR
jgi:cell division protein FtsX